MFFVLQGHLRDVGHAHPQSAALGQRHGRTGALYGQPLGIDDKPGAKPIAIGEGAIAFDNVTFQYGSHATPLYRDFSVDIAPGERVGLVGHSGSGKTTFVKLIQRLYDVNSGRITIDGQNIADVQQASLAQPDRHRPAGADAVPPLAGRKHRLCPPRRLARSRSSWRRGRPAPMISSWTLPKGYETLVGERGIKLSGGERQRVAIARAFLADAPILILDEATSSLDSESEVLIQQAMERLMVGRTTLVIAHRLSTVRALDRLLVFDKGRIVEEGDHQSLIGLSGGIYRRLFERQALELTKGLKIA